MNNINDITFYGIDPSFRKGGFAVCSIKNGLVSFQQCSFVDWLLKTVRRSESQDGRSFWCVENSNKQGVSFDKSGSPAVLSRKSRNVGMNQAASQLTFDLLERLDHEAVEVSAKEKGRKWSMADFEYQLKARKHKLSEPVNGRGISQDRRDAYKLGCMAEKYFNQLQKQK